MSGRFADSQTFKSPPLDFKFCFTVSRFVYNLSHIHHYVKAKRRFVIIWSFSFFLFTFCVLSITICKEVIAVYLEKLKEYREEKGLSQKDLAEIVNVSPASISNYENEIREPKFETLCTLADFFDCSLDMLVRGKEKDRPEERSKEGLMNLFDSMSLPELRLAQALVSMSIAYKELQSAPGSGGQ